MTHEVTTQWMGDMQFNALINGHTIIMDGPERSGGHDLGPIPKPFILSALSGCTGMDIAALLKKWGKRVEDLSIMVMGSISKQAPVTYTAIHLIYNFKGLPENANAAMEAVQLSQERYCGVSALLKKALPVTWDIYYNGKTLYRSTVPNENIQA